MNEACPRCGADLAQTVVRVKACYFAGIHVPQWRVVTHCTGCGNYARLEFTSSEVGDDA